VEPRGKKIPRRRWDDNIKMNLRETVWEGVNLIKLDRDRAGGGNELV
jgi:hypothetical protein